MVAALDTRQPVFLEPQPPRDDVEAQQASWGRLLDALLISAFALGTLGAILLAWGISDGGSHAGSPRQALKEPNLASIRRDGSGTIPSRVDLCPPRQPGRGRR